MQKLVAKTLTGCCVGHTEGSSRAAWPVRTSLSLGSAAARRSTRLSTAMLDAAVASTCSQGPSAYIYCFIAMHPA